MSAGAASAPRIPLEVRLGLASPFSAAVTGVLVAVFVFGVYVLLRLAGGDPLWDFSDPGGVVNARTHVSAFNAILIGYLIAMMRHVAITTARDLHEFTPASELIAVPGRVEKVIATDPVALRRSRWAGIVGVILWESLFMLSGGFPLDLSLPWLMLSFAITGWLLGGVAYLGVQMARDTTRLAQGIDVDLFDLRRFHSFSRVGLRLALVTLSGVGIIVLAGYADPNPQDVAPALPIVVAFLTGCVVLGVMALVLPVRGIQQRIRDAKLAELDRLDGELRRLRDASDAEPGRMADLVAQRSYVERLPEWPFDASTLGRFALYLLIPLLSWLGGALVERGVDSLFE